MKLPKPIRRFFEDCDMFLAPATLRIRDQPQMKSVGQGVLSFIVGCFFAYVFIANCVKVFQYQNISSSQTHTTIRSSQTNGIFQTFAITLDFLDIDQFYTMFQFTAYYIINGTYAGNFELRQCQESDWVLLGDNYKVEFNDYFIGSMLCPTVVQQYKLNETFRSNTPDYISVQLTLCDVTERTCDHTKAQTYLQTQTTQWGSAQIWVYVMDKSIQPNKKDSVSYFINIDAKAQVSSNFGGTAVIQFSNFQINTDMSVMPVQQIETVKGCFIDIVRTYQLGFTTLATDTLARVQFTMNQKKYITVRKVGKLDQLLSYAGGLFSIIIGFLAWFLMSYNQYKYQLYIAENTLNYDESGKKIKQSDFWFWNYVAYTIYDWIALLCCCTPNWTKCIQVDQTRQKVVRQLQTDRLLRRLTNMENSIKSMMNKEENVVMSIISHPNIGQLQQDFLLQDYYNEICNGRCPLTLSQFSMDQTNIYAVKNQPSQKQKKQQNNQSNIQLGQIKVVNSVSILNKTSQIKSDQGTDRLYMLKHIKTKYPQIKAQADSIILSAQYQQVQNKIASSFYKLDRGKRIQMQQKIPVIILYRIKSKGEPENQKKGKYMSSQNIEFG